MTEINGQMYASLVKPGMIIDTEAGERIAVEKVTEGYGTRTFEGWGRTVTVAFGERVTLRHRFEV